MNKTHLPGWSADYFRKFGNIGTVVDVGVLKGTPELYDAFPDAYLVLIEALPSCEAACRAILANRSGEVFMVAAGDRDGETKFHFLPESPGGSSLLSRLKGSKQSAIQVPMRRLDTLLSGRTFKDDILLKIDVEGAEHLVIAGAAEFLRGVRFCVAEMRVAVRHSGSYRASDFMAMMKRSGFELFDILTVTRHRDGRPGARIVDAVFVHE